MANDNAQPLLVAGKLPKQCYTDLDEFVQDISKVLALPLDAVAVIKGAKGDKGDRGEKGGEGAVGPAGSGVKKDTFDVSIPMNVTYVEFTAFLGWETAIYSIGYNGRVGATGSIPVFNPANGIVGPGITVAVHSTTTASPTKIRHYFTFFGGSPAIVHTPNEHFILRITALS